MTTHKQAEGNTGVLDRLGVDIAGLVGDMPAQPCEYLEFESSPRCVMQAKWAARLHVADHRCGVCWVEVESICDRHKKELVAMVAQDAGRPCDSCGATTAAVLRVMPL